MIDVSQLIHLEQVPTAVRPHVKQLIELAGSEGNFLVVLSATIVFIVVMSCVALRRDQLARSFEDVGSCVLEANHVQVTSCSCLLRTSLRSRIIYFLNYSNFRHAGSSKGKETKAFLSKERVSVPLIDKVSLSHDTRRFRFGLPTKDHVLGLPVGQHFTLYAPNVQGVVKSEWNGRPDPEAEESEIERKYTPTSGDHEKGYFDLVRIHTVPCSRCNVYPAVCRVRKDYVLGKYHTALRQDRSDSLRSQVIKVYKKGEKPQFPDGGKMSQHLDSLEVGKDTVDIKGPTGRVNYKGCGQFVLGRKELPKKHNIGMMAGGTGITPMLQMIAAVLRNPADKSKMSLLYANQTEDDILIYFPNMNSASYAQLRLLYACIPSRTETPLTATHIMTEIQADCILLAGHENPPQLSSPTPNNDINLEAKTSRCIRDSVREELEGLAKANPDRLKVWYTVDRPATNWQYSSGFITAEMIQ
eukprot:1192768-Prorocentrum_minimum.AAC.1